MAMIDYKKIMLDMIRLLLDERWSVPEFEAAFYYFYIDKVPEHSSLTDRDHEFFFLVQETLEWTAENPDPEDRKYAWINHQEFVAFVRLLIKRYENGEELDLPRDAGRTSS